MALACHNQQLLSNGAKFQTSFFSFLVCLNLKLILNNRKPQNQICDWTQDFFFFCYSKILSQVFLHDSHIWFWRFLYILGSSGPRCAAHGWAYLLLPDDFLKICKVFWFLHTFPTMDRKHFWCQILNLIKLSKYISKRFLTAS